MDQNLFRASEAVRDAGTGARGRKNTAQHYARILLDLGWSDDRVVGCVRDALRGGVIKEFILYLEDRPR